MALFRTGLYVKNHSVEKVQVAKTPIASYNGNVTGLYIPELIAYITAQQSGSGTPAPDNIRPITGWNGAVVNRCGVNVWDEETIVASSRIQSKNYISVKPSTQYRRVTPENIYVIYFDKEKNEIGHANWGKTAFTTPADCYFIKIMVDPVYGTTYNNDISINYPSTDTDYHAYNGNPYSFFFEGLLNGTYDFVDLGSLTWGKSSQATNTFVATGNIPENYPMSGGDGQVLDAIISCGYNAVSYNSLKSSGSDKVMSYRSSASGKGLEIRDSDYSSYYDDFDADTFKLVVSGIYLIYKKTSASTPTITQAQIDTLATAFGVGDKSAIIVFGQEVFGGYVNVETGVLTITYKGIDLSILSWNYSTQNSAWASLDVTDAKLPADNSEVFDAMCSTYVVVSFQSVATKSIAMRRNGTLYCNNDDDTNTPTGQLVYKLDTPITVQLTPKQLEQLLANNVFADTGDVEVKFYNVVR